MPHFFRRFLWAWVAAVLLLVLPVSPFTPVPSASAAPLKTVRVAVTNSSTMMKVSKTDMTGYAFEYIETLAKYAGWNVVYQEYEGFSACLEKVRQGEADLFYNVSRTPERETAFLFPRVPMGSEDYYIYARADDVSMIAFDGTYQSLQGKSIGFLEGTMQTSLLKAWCESNDVALDLVPFPSSVALKNAFLSGKIDLDFDTNRLSNPNFFVLAKLGSSDYYLAANRHREDLIADINAAQAMLSDIDPLFPAGLFHDKFPLPIKNTPLSPKALAWIKQHDVVRVGCFAGDVPFAFKDEQTGQVTGVGPKLLDLILSRLKIANLKSRFVLYHDRKSMLADVHAGKLDLIFPYFSDFHRAKGDHLILSKKAAQVPMAIAHKLDVRIPEAWRTIFVPDTYLAKYYAQRTFPESEVLTCEKPSECIHAAVANNGACALNHPAILAELLASHADMRSSLLSQTAPICFAAGEESAGLIHILDKGLMRVSSPEVQALFFNPPRSRTMTLRKFVLGYWGTLLMAGMGIILLLVWVNSVIRRQRDRLSQALTLAEKANRAKTAFLNNISHDIRTPMNAIIGFTHQAIAHFDEKEHLREYLDKIALSGEHLLSLINDVLDMSRIESGKVTLEPKPVNLPDLIAALQKIIQADMEEKRLHLSTQIQLRDKDVLCDSLRLNQILLNLLSNAVKFSKSDDTVTLRVLQEETSETGRSTYEFSVEDTGIGMSAEFQKRIFEPFERERTTTVSGVTGTGLGMAITKRLVEMMGGTISVESAEGKGSKFHVLLTFESCAPLKPSLDRAVRDEEGFSGTTVLLVEDIPLNRELAQEILTEKGFAVETARNGAEAVEKFSAANPPYDLILMDVQMPVMDGYAATRAIRSLPGGRGAAVPIIAMTANAFEEDRQKALQAGMNGHIAKPIDVRRLFETLNETLR
ncbi:MAG: response regulator [Desulfovibrio sp.]|nr:response regulator [Desulfovibrio sp.]